MIKTSIYAAIAVLGFASVYGLQRDEHSKYQHKACLVQREGRIQGNLRAEHLKLVENAIITSNEKAQKEITGYSYPQSVAELRDSTPIELLPIEKC